MKPPILLMDGVSDPDEATWVEFYDTIEDIRRKLEPWFVDEPHVILDANGARLDIVRRKYGPTEQVDLELLAQAPRPDIVRRFVVKELLSAASGHGSVLMDLIPADLLSLPLEELWSIHQKCVAWHRDNPPPRRSLLDRLKWFLPRAWQ